MEGGKIVAVEVFKLFGSIFVNNDEANNSIAKTDEKASGVASTLGNGVKTAAKWGAAIVGGATAAAGGIAKIASDTASAGDEVDKMSQKLGLSRTAYQEWDFVLSQNGMDINSMQAGIKTMTNQLDDAINGSTSATEKFNKLGLSVQDLKNMSREDVFSAVITQMQGMGDTTERAALASDLFGKSGSNLTPLLNSTAESTEELKNKAHELGMIMSDETVDSSVKFTDTMDALKRSGQGLMVSIGGSLLPIVQQFADKLTEYMPQIKEMIDGLTPVVSSFFEQIVPVLFKLGESLLPPIMNLLQQIMPVIGQIMEVLAPIITEIVETLMPPLIQIVETLLPPILNIVTALLPLLQTLFDLVSPIIDLVLELIAPISELIANAIAPLLTVFAELLNELLRPLIPVFMEIVNTIVGSLQPVFQSLYPVFNTITELLKPIFNVLSILLNSILPALTPVIETLANVFSNQLGTALDFINGLITNAMNIFQGLIDFITGVFTGNWEQAWNGVVDVFKGVFNLIPTIIEYIINGAINLINGLLSGINWAIDILGWEIPLIPNVTLPRFRAGIDYVPGDKFPALLDEGEAVLNAQEAEEYRRAKRGDESIFGQKTENKTINNIFNISLEDIKITSDRDIDSLARILSEKLATEYINKAGAFS